MRALAGWGVAFGLVLGAVACSSGGSGPAPGLEDSRFETNAAQAVTQGELIPVAANRFWKADLSLSQGVASAGTITAISFYADLSGGVGRINVDGTQEAHFVFGRAAHDFHDPFSTEHTTRSGATVTKFDLWIPSMPNGFVSGKPWSGEARFRWKRPPVSSDGAQPNDLAPAAILLKGRQIQLKGLTGVNTLRDDDTNDDDDDSKWTAMAPSATAVCMATPDCALDGLDQSYTCANDACQPAQPLTCHAVTTYSFVPSLKLPPEFEDCATTPLSIASFFAKAGAQAERLVSDLRDCQARIEKLNACAASTDQTFPLCASEPPLLVSPPEASGFAPYKCFIAEANATTELAILEERSASCESLLVFSQNAFDSGCLSKAASTVREAKALVADGVSAANAIALLPLQCPRCTRVPVAPPPTGDLTH